MSSALSAAFYDALAALSGFIGLWRATPDSTKVIIMVLVAALGVYGGSQSESSAVSAGLVFSGFVLLAYALYLGMTLI